MLISEETILRNLIQEWEKSYLENKEFFTDRQLLEIFPEAKRYLEERLIKLEKEIKTLTLQIKISLKRTLLLKGFKKWFQQQIIKVWAGDKLDRLIKEHKELSWLLNPPRFRKGKITNEDIQRAKQQPFSKFLEIRNKIWALCPFHPDKRPSLYLKNEFYHCFSCKESGDIIDLTMKLRGLDFVSAVKMLNN
ncbi:MAG: CHC2 zinc finger domain-containing protein [Patescibacteria group bacterium]|nr:CHC2 zinc finger domain-containing protein [Patescibacteria group bacterium]